MFQDPNYRGLSPTEFWQKATSDLDHLLVPEDAALTTLSNAAAFLGYCLDRVNWVGFYLFDGRKLVLGPFAGKPACTTIKIGEGVCGTAAEREETVIVEDVDKFPGHIACDAASRAEIVIPLFVEGKLFGVLDVDSPEVGRFEPDDAIGLERMAKVITSKIPRPNDLLSSN